VSDPLPIVDRLYRLTWRENDVEGAFGDLDPDFEWVVPGHPEGAVRRGSAGVIGFIREWREPWEDMEVDWELHPVDAERVLAVMRQRARGRVSGASVALRFAQLWTVREGRAVRMVLYTDVDKGFAAAGLRS
jgi:ketosteroid isomerase-like protein